MVEELELYSQHLKKIFLFIAVNLDTADKQQEENRNPL